MSAEKGSSKADTLVKVVLVFFISLLSFSVGTFVGKQVSDSDHRRMALEGETKADRQVASSDENKDEESGKITAKEVDSLTEEFVAKEKNAGAGAGETAANEEASEKSEPAATEEKADAAGYKTYKRETVAKEKDTKPAKDPKEVAEKVAEGAAPTNGETETRKPSSATLPSVAASAVGKYTVQVGAYAEENEAKEEVKDIGEREISFPQ